MTFISRQLNVKRAVETAPGGPAAAKSASADSEQGKHGTARYGFLRRPSVVVAVLLALVVAAVWAVAVIHAAAPPTEDQRVYTIASQLQCPVCNGESVADAPTPIAEEMRSVIREKVREGWSDSQILAYFHTRYGDTILESPPFNGFTLIIWIAPLLVLLIGGFILWTAGREWARSARPVLAGAGAGAGVVADSPRGAERDTLLRELRRELELDDDPEDNSGKEGRR
ncbi:MAG TPA: cytochrome c-type biogenesis protein [Ktedonobacterales bacterium]